MVLKMTAREQLYLMMLDYDFKKNSVRSFARKLGICDKTVVKYLRIHNIPYNQRKLVVPRKRTALGRFALVFKKDLVKRQDIKKVPQPAELITERPDINKVPQHAELITKRPDIKSMTSRERLEYAIGKRLN